LWEDWESPPLADHHDVLLVSQPRGKIEKLHLMAYHADSLPSINFPGDGEKLSLIAHHPDVVSLIK
jgi:hypothetical protein